MSEVIMAAIIAATISLAGSMTVFIIAWRKSRSEEKKNLGEAEESEAQADLNDASASETWARSNQMAALQIVDMQKDLRTERKLRLEMDAKITCLELQVNSQEGRIRRLEAQLVSLGVEPVK